MLRMTLLLCAGMLAALMIAGEDNGQLRPGLALAASEGRLDDVWAEARAKVERKPVPVVAVAAPAPEPVAEPAPVVEAAAPVVPEPVVAPVREVVQVVAEPVFTLSALGNEPVPGADGTVVETAAVVEPEPEALPGGEGTIWYVNASSVNVRAEPSTEAEVLGKLGNGEATLLVAAVNDEWARIVIQGDGMEGYVALRFLSPESP